MVELDEQRSDGAAIGEYGHDAPPTAAASTLTTATANTRA